MNSLVQLDLFAVPGPDSAPARNIRPGTWHWNPCGSCREWGSEWWADCAIAAHAGVHGYYALRRLCDRCVSRLAAGETLPWIHDGAGTGFTTEIVIEAGHLQCVKLMHGEPMPMCDVAGCCRTYKMEPVEGAMLCWHCRQDLHLGIELRLRGGRVIDPAGVEVTV